MERYSGIVREELEAHPNFNDWLRHVHGKVIDRGTEDIVNQSYMPTSEDLKSPTQLVPTPGTDEEP